MEEELALSNGLKATHMTIKHPGAVVVLPITQDGQVLFVRQYRHSIGEYLLELPAGALNIGEDPLKSAERELQEETGFAAHEMIPLGTAFPVPGFCSEVQHFFVAKNLYESRLPADEDEQIEVEPYSVLAIENFIKKGELKDSKSAALFFRARLNGLI